MLQRRRATLAKASRFLSLLDSSTSTNPTPVHERSFKITWRMKWTSSARHAGESSTSGVLSNPYVESLSQSAMPTPFSDKDLVGKRANLPKQANGTFENVSSGQGFETWGCLCKSEPSMVLSIKHDAGGGDVREVL